MKSMSDRKMDMPAGKPKSEGFFPEESHSKELKRPGEIRGNKYPDTEEMVYANQNSMVKGISNNMPKDSFRH